MKLDFTKLQAGFNEQAIIHPRQIFTTLNRTPKFKRPLDEQADVLSDWFEKREQKDITLKMNTGAGKTVVGLLALQSSIKEGIYPAVYITPDSYLSGQVSNEAKQLGIAVTDDVNDPDFLSGKSILIANIHKLVNGKSVFGVGGNKKIPIGAIVIDDAHACLSSVAEQFSIQIKSDNVVFKHLLALFREDLNRQSPVGVLEIENSDGRSPVVMEVPYWSWRSKSAELVKILHANKTDPNIEWKWDLIKDVLPLCQCIFSPTRLEIKPRFLPIDTIASFSGASRRIYMTATLADDGVLVSHLQANPELIKNPVIPQGGGDIGDRMIIAPQEINTAITNEEIKALVAHLSKTRNVAVIVPSHARAEYWSEVSDQVLDSKNLTDGVEKMRSGHVGLTVLVNKYDGIDLPGNACQLLVIDGLPEAQSLSETIESKLLEGTDPYLLKQIQRIEQGMGRGVRSSEDHCVVLLMGAQLAQKTHLKKARDKFSRATKAQLDLGNQITNQIKKGSIADMVEVMNLCFERNPEWVETSRKAVLSAPEQTGGYLDDKVVSLRKAFDSARIERFDLACKELQEVVNSVDDPILKGYYKQQLAEYQNHINPTTAQETQLSALQLNPRLLKPIDGVTYTKLTPVAADQSLAAMAFMAQFDTSNDLVMWTNGILEDLSWGSDHMKFEGAVKSVGDLLGFGSQRPETENGVGPDNLWALGAQKYVIIECKNEATGKEIIKHDCNQLNGSLAWFKEKYDHTCEGVPVIIHPSQVFNRAGTPFEGTRVIDGESLNKFKEKIGHYVTSLTDGNNYKNSVEIGKLLKHYGLSSDVIINNITVSPK